MTVRLPCSLDGKFKDKAELGVFNAVLLQKD